ncbi:hypothetical protein MMC18_000370 [Xylographa bjoerkii]|nr:hypothetical protein [Xylographa bjoerkii]
MARKLLAVRFTGSSPDTEKVQSTKPPRKYGSIYAPISTRNRAQSPLLRLPYEVRRLIWRHLLGDKIIHLIDTEKVAMSQEVLMRSIPGHVICNADDGNTISHEKCLGHTYCTPVAPDYKHCKDCTINFSYQHLDLRALRVCSDIYSGTIEVLMSTNTFYFDYNFRPSVLKPMWDDRFSFAMKRIRLTVPGNWRLSTEIRRVLDVTKTLHSCQDLQIDLHQNSWIPEDYTYQYWFGSKDHDRIFADLNEFMESSAFDNVEVFRYLDSSLGPETLPATCRHQYDSAGVLQVRQLEKVLQWSQQDASLVNEYVRTIMNGGLSPGSCPGQDHDSEPESAPEDNKPDPSALLGYLRRSKEDFRTQLTAYWKYLRGMPLQEPHE